MLTNPKECFNIVYINNKQRKTKMNTLDNKTANIIKNNATVNAAYVACVIAYNNYNAYAPRDYNGATVAHIAQLENEYNKAAKAFQKALKAAKSNA